MSENTEKINLNNEIKLNKEKNYNMQMQRIPQRNYGIDLLKILSMINIINLHINNHTNQLNLGIRNPKYKPVYRLEVFSFFPVNVFGLVSGIIGYKKYKFINIIYIWFEYFFYSVFLTMFLYYKSMTNFRNLILSFFPLGILRHWYVNSYIFMYLFLPFITDSLNKISCIFRIRLHVSCFILISFYFSYKIISERNTIKIKKRFERLLIPYFIFPIIVSLINNFSFHYFNFSIFRRNINFHDLFIQFAVGRQFILVFWFQFFLIWTSLLFIIISFLFKKSS